MAGKLSWSPEAIEDIEAIATYIERDSPWYAQAVVSKLHSVAELIPDFPEAGRVVPEISNPNIREKFIYSYRLIYRIESNHILIAAVIHGRSLLEPFAQRIEESF
jgi:toxin ParE1/3/4